MINRQGGHADRYKKRPGRESGDFRKMAGPAKRSCWQTSRSMGMFMEISDEMKVVWYARMLMSKTRRKARGKKD